MSFLPENYKIPKGPSNYLKFEDGLNSIRILSSAIVGYQYFNKENKPIKSREPFEDVPTDIKQGGKVKPFWAFVVFNNNEKLVQILELTQKTIMRSVKALVDNPKWGDPKMYDIAITKTGEGLDAEYSVQGEPPIAEPLAEVKIAYENKPVNLQALFDNEDPFKKDDISDLASKIKF